MLRLFEALIALNYEKVIIEDKDAAIIYNSNDYIVSECILNREVQHIEPVIDTENEKDVYIVIKLKPKNSFCAENNIDMKYDTYWDKIVQRLNKELIEEKQKENERLQKEIKRLERENYCLSCGAKMDLEE